MMVSLGRDTFERGDWLCERFHISRFISESDLRGGEEDNQMLEFHNGIAQYQDTSTLRPTLQNVHIRDVWDAKKVFYAVATGVLPLVTRPPYKTERPSIRPGNVYVWEEHGPGHRIHSAPSSVWQTRWKDGVYWEPIRSEGGLLWHMERDPTLELRPLYDAFEHAPVEAIAEEDLMVRQHYDVVATLPTIDGPSRSRKWILIAYCTGFTKNKLSTLDNLPWLMDPPSPEGDYRFRHIRCCHGFRRRSDVSASAGRRLAPLWDLARYRDRESLPLYRPLSEHYSSNDSADTAD